MSIHETTFSVTVEDDVDAALEQFVEFYTHNGYEAEDSDGDTERRVLTRNRDRSSWWTSNMTELPTRLRIEPVEDEIRLDYRIDAEGQHLTDDDRNFWRRESQRAEAYVHGHGELVDLRPEEASRAHSQQWEMRVTAMKAAAIVMMIIFIAGIVGTRFGCL